MVLVMPGCIGVTGMVLFALCTVLLPAVAGLSSFTVLNNFFPFSIFAALFGSIAGYIFLVPSAVTVYLIFKFVHQRSNSIGFGLASIIGAVGALVALLTIPIIVKVFNLEPEVSGWIFPYGDDFFRVDGGIKAGSSTPLLYALVLFVVYPLWTVSFVRLLTSKNSE
jgi:hypothetical protein